MSCALHVWNLYTVFIDTNIEQDWTLNNSNFVYRVAWTTCAYTQGTPGLWKYRTVVKHNFKLSTCVFLIFSLCPSRYRLPPLCFMSGLHSPVAGSKSSSRARGSPMSCSKFLFPSLPASSHLGCPISCGKFLFSSPYLPVPILDVPSPVVNSFSRLPTCQFPSWMSHLLW